MELNTTLIRTRTRIRRISRSQLERLDCHRRTPPTLSTKLATVSEGQGDRTNLGGGGMTHGTSGTGG
jgi:hypothetical protein